MNTDLVRLSPPIEALRADYWSVTHPDLSRNPSVRAVMDWIITCFRTLGQQLDGAQPP